MLFTAINSRLSIDAQVGLRPAVSLRTRSAVMRTAKSNIHAFNTSHGVVSVADAEGVGRHLFLFLVLFLRDRTSRSLHVQVIVLYLAKMKRPFCSFSLPLQTANETR